MLRYSLPLGYIGDGSRRSVEVGGLAGDHRADPGAGSGSGALQQAAPQRSLSGHERSADYGRLTIVKDYVRPRRLGQRETLTPTVAKRVGYDLSAVATPIRPLLELMVRTAEKPRWRADF
jgi:hypothetical protein